jgi:hypothetical protein
MHVTWWKSLAHRIPAGLRRVGFDVVEGTNLTRGKIAEKPVVSRFEIFMKLGGSRC